MRYAGYTATHMRGVVTVEAKTSHDALALARVLRPDVIAVSMTISPLVSEMHADSLDQHRVFLSNCDRIARGTA